MVKSIKKSIVISQADVDQEDLYYDLADVVIGQNEIDDIQKQSKNQQTYTKTCVCLILLVTNVITVVVCAGLFVVLGPKHDTTDCPKVTEPEEQIKDETCPVKETTKCMDIKLDSMFRLDDTLYWINAEKARNSCSRL